MSDTDEFFAERPVERRRGRGAAAGLFVVFGVLVVLALLAVVADVVTRTVVESRAATEIESAVGVDEARVEVHGLSVLWQIVHGRLDDVTISSGTASDPLSFRVDVSDVPTDLTGTSGPVSGSLTVDAATIDQLDALSSVGAAVTLGDGDVTYQRSFDVPVVGPVPVEVTADPSVAADGTVLRLAPTRAALSDTSLSIDLTGFLGDFAIDVCVAEQVPEGVRLTWVDVAEGRAVLQLRSEGLPLSSSGLGSRGSCS